MTKSDLDAYTDLWENINEDTADKTVTHVEGNPTAAGELILAFAVIVCSVFVYPILPSLLGVSGLNSFSYAGTAFVIFVIGILLLIFATIRSLPKKQ